MSEIKKIIKLLEQFDQSSNYTSMQKEFENNKISSITNCTNYCSMRDKIETETALPAARGIWLD